VSDLKEELRRLGILPGLSPTKRCRHCGAWKARADFKPNVRVSDGLSSWCQECHNEGTRAWKAKKKASDPAYRATEYERARQRGKGATVSEFGEFDLVVDQKEEDRMASHPARDETGPMKLFAQYMHANPTPRISPELRVKDLAMCVRTVVRSESGTCPEGQVMRADDPIVVGSPEAFIPLVQWIG
jgi:hypothetical protein